MIRYLIVLSEVTAFVCVGSRFVAVRTLPPSHRTIGADASSARANEVGEASIAPFAPPTSRLGITEGWVCKLHHTAVAASHPVAEEENRRGVGIPGALTTRQ